jgi:hypothetical protein
MFEVWDSFVERLEEKHAGRRKVRTARGPIPGFLHLGADCPTIAAVQFK